MDQNIILLVEENSTNTQLIKKHLDKEKMSHFEIFEASTLKAAFELLPHYDFDAILVSLNLPDSMGLETVRKLTTQLPDTAIIAITDQENDEFSLQAVRYGAQDFLEKRQLSSPYLSKSILYAIERKKVLQEKEDLLEDLSQAFLHIEHLENLLPLCVSCKKILGEDNEWYLLREIRNRDIAKKQIRNLICPSCQTTLDSSRREVSNR